MHPAERVQTFLRRMEHRDLDAAEAMMADHAVIIFPGGKRFYSQREMVAAAAGRYRYIKKTFDTIEHFSQGERDIVYVIGTLYGVNIHDVPFENIRYIDRFVLYDGKIVEQHVWNDLAESGVLTRKSEFE